MTTTTPETAAAPAGDDAATLGRRRVLVTSAVAVAGVAVTAACGSSSGGGSAASSSASSSTIDVKTADVPVGGGVILADTKVVVTQPTAGTYKAFSAVCTHQGCVVASVSDGTIHCPCHGSTFSAADGSVLGGPAPAALKTLAVAVNGADLTVTP